MSKYFLFYLLIPCLSFSIKKPKPVIAPQGKLAVSNVFNPQGYYFSTKPIRLKRYSLNWVSIFAGANKLYTVQLRLTDGKGQWQDVEANKFNIKPGSTFFHFHHKDLGNIVIEGKFTGTKGPMEDDVEAMKTIVFKGAIIFSGTSTSLNLTWFQGD